MVVKNLESTQYIEVKATAKCKGIVEDNFVMTRSEYNLMNDNSYYYKLYRVHGVDVKNNKHNNIMKISNLSKGLSTGQAKSEPMSYTITF